MHDIKTKPYGPLMVEHRIIEDALQLISGELGGMEQGADPDMKIIDFIIDFFHIYADVCHHGKEENILFRRLDKKELSEDHRDIMKRLLDDHETARCKIKELKEVAGLFKNGEAGAKDNISRLLKELAELYPKHISTEDKEFFLPCMAYFTEDEQRQMVEEFWEADRKMIHEKYRQDIKAIKERKGD